MVDGYGAGEDDGGGGGESAKETLALAATSGGRHARKVLLCFSTLSFMTDIGLATDATAHDINSQ